MSDTDVAVACIIRNDELLIGLRNYTADVWKDISIWTIPGGRCSPQETLEKTIQREVMEEVGIGNLQILSYLGKVPGTKDNDVVHIFVCSTKEEPKLMEPEKFSEWKWCDINKIPKNFINPKGLRVLKKHLSSPNISHSFDT